MTVNGQEVNPFHLPFIAVYWLVRMLFWLPWPIAVVLILGGLAYIIVASFQEAGPFRIAALARRFSWVGVPAAIVVGLWLWMSIYPTIFHVSLRTSFIIGIAIILYAFIAWFLIYVIMRDHNSDNKIWIRCIRRMRFRLRWDSIAKSCNLSHMKDARPKDWTTGGTSITVVGERVQWVPILWHGRRSPSGTSTDYLFRPARGQSAARIVEQLEPIAIAAHAHSATFNESPHLNWWTLTIYWSDPAEHRPPLDWHVIDANSKVSA